MGVTKSENSLLDEFGCEGGQGGTHRQRAGGPRQAAAELTGPSDPGPSESLEHGGGGTMCSGGGRNPGGVGVGGGVIGGSGNSEQQRQKVGGGGQNRCTRGGVA